MLRLARPAPAAARPAAGDDRLGRGSTVRRGAGSRPAPSRVDARSSPRRHQSTWTDRAVIARMARIPDKQAHASDKERLRTLEEQLMRVVFGQDDAVKAVARAIKRARAGLGQPEQPAGCFLFTGPTGVGKTELAKQLAHSPRQPVRPLRHVRVHGEARRRAPHRRPSGIRRLRTGRPAGRRDPARIRMRCCCSTRSRRRTRHLQHPAAGDGPRHADRQHRPQGRLPAGDPDHDVQRGVTRDEPGAGRLR